MKSLEDLVRRTGRIGGFKWAKHQFEEAYIREVLDMTKGNITAAARVARLDRKHFYDKMSKFGISTDEYR